MQPQETNALRAAALAPIPKTERKALRLPRYLFARAGEEGAGERGAELGLMVGVRGQGHIVPKAKEVAGLLERMATEDAPVRHLVRRGAKGSVWKAKDLTVALGGEAASGLHTLELWSHGFDAAAYRALSDARLDSLRRLDLRFVTAIDSEGLAALGTGDWPALQHLALGRVEASADELAGLIEALPALTSLELVEWPAGKDGLGALFADLRFARLRRFVTSPRVEVAGGDCLVRLAEAPSLALKALSLPAGSMRGLGLGAFLRSALAAQLRWLEGMAIVPAITDALPDACPFARLEHLALSVAGNNLDLDALSALLPPDLASLHLTDATEPGTTPHALQRCPNLQQLHVKGRSAQPLGLEPLAHATSVRELRLGPCLAGDAIERLPELPHLERLYLTCKNRQTRVAALAGAPWQPQLRELAIEQAGLDDEDAQALAACPWEHLGMLSLSRNNIKAAGVAALAGASLPQLHTLDLGYNVNLARKGMGPPELKALTNGKALPHLQRLTVPSCSKTAAQTKARKEHPTVLVTVASS